MLYRKKYRYRNIKKRYRISHIFPISCSPKMHTKYVKMAGLENIHLNTVYVLSGWEQLGENLMCVNILS